jgi:hypothetical protein
MTTLAELRRHALRVLIPPPRLRLSTWIEQNIRLPEGGSALPGHSGWRRTWLRSPTRSRPGGRACGFGQGRTARLHDAADRRDRRLRRQRAEPVLVLLPTESDARDYVVSDIEPIFAASPTPRGLLSDDIEEGERNTLLHRRFHGGNLKIVAATRSDRTPPPRRSRPAVASWSARPPSPSHPAAPSRACGSTASRSRKPLRRGKCPCEQVSLHIMGRGPCPFTGADVRRAVKAISAADGGRSTTGSSSFRLSDDGTLTQFASRLDHCIPRILGPTHGRTTTLDDRQAQFVCVDWPGHFDVVVYRRNARAFKTSMRLLRCSSTCSFVMLNVRLSVRRG